MKKPKPEKREKPFGWVCESCMIGYWKVDFYTLRRDAKEVHFDKECKITPLYKKEPKSE